MDKKEVAIRVNDLVKVYTLYNKPSDRLKEAFTDKNRDYQLFCKIFCSVLSTNLLQF